MLAALPHSAVAAASGAVVADLVVAAGLVAAAVVVAVARPAAQTFAVAEQTHFDPFVQTDSWLAAAAAAAAVVAAAAAVELVATCYFAVVVAAAAVAAAAAAVDEDDRDQMSCRPHLQLENHQNSCSPPALPRAPAARTTVAAAASHPPTREH